MKGRRIGSEGVEGNIFSAEDEELARRRYAEFVSLTKDLEPYSYCFEDILPLLPLDGGTRFPCGDTRFEHLQDDKCKNPTGKGNPKCGYLQRNGLKCAKKVGHTGGHQSRGSMKREAATVREYRRKQREREMD